MNSFGFYIDCTQEQTNAISEIPQVLPLIYCFLRGKEQSCKIPKIPAQAKGVKERRENEMQGQIVLDHTFTGLGENAHKYKMQIRTNTFCKWPQILKLSCYVFAVPQMPSCSHFNATLPKSFVTKPQRAMNMFIHSCFKNTVIHSSRASRKTEYLIVVCSARISLRYSVSMWIQKRRFF